MINTHLKSLFLIVCWLFAASCHKQDPGEQNEFSEPDEQPDVSREVGFTSFGFGIHQNVLLLTQNIDCSISDDRITALIASAKTADGLIPVFTGSFEKVEVDGVLQQSGVNAHDFNSPVTYTLTGKDGQTRSYRVVVKVYTGLPIVTVTTDGGLSVTDKDTYVDGSVSIGKTPDFTSGYEGRMRMKGRGNATWGYEKKPYRIKLDTKSEILDMPADKDWVLLAEYCDRSLLRTTYGFELSRLAGLPWTSRSQHVEFFMNGIYQGTYLLCEHVKAAENRANVSDDGFLFERDNYWYQEPLWFTTVRGHHYTFKYPDAEDMTEGDADYTFINDFMDEFEQVLYSDSFKDPATGYRKYIDADNFARWFLVQETLGNIEPNPYFVLESRSDKLKMYPVWDFEWSLGLAARNTDGTWASRPATSPVSCWYWRNNVYFDRLFEDDYFVNIVKTHRQTMKTEWLPALAVKTDEVKENIKYAQAENFKRWQIMGKYVSVELVSFSTWEQEVNYMKDFLQKRIEWLDTQFNE